MQEVQGKEFFLSSMLKPEPENESNYRIIRPESIRFGRIESNRIEFLEEKTESNRTECQFFK